jgi:hypothetical protein
VLICWPGSDDPVTRQILTWPLERNWTIHALTLASLYAVPLALAASLMSRRDWVNWAKSIGVGNLVENDGVVFASYAPPWKTELGGLELGQSKLLLEHVQCCA